MAEVLINIALPTRNLNVTLAFRFGVGQLIGALEMLWLTLNVTPVREEVARIALDADRYGDSLASFGLTYMVNEVDLWLRDRVIFKAITAPFVVQLGLGINLASCCIPRSIRPKFG